MIGSLPATETLVFFTSFTGRAPSRESGATYWNPRGNSDLRGGRGGPRKPSQNRGLANTAATAVQQGASLARALPAPRRPTNLHRWDTSPGEQPRYSLRRALERPRHRRSGLSDLRCP